MNNRNALVSMAQFSATDANPYKVMSEFIEQVLHAASKPVSVSYIKQEVNKLFSINLEYYVIEYCLGYLARQNRVQKNESGLIGLAPGNQEDLEAFTRRRHEYQNLLRDFVGTLITFAKENYHQVWQYTEAYELLLYVLDKDRLIYDLIVDDHEAEKRIATTYAADGDKIFTSANIVGKFIAKATQENSDTRDLLIQICSGLMLCANVFMLPEIDTEPNRTDIEGTTFYFDTKLLLRTIGCANEAAVEAARELVKMVQQRGGLVACYETNLNEMEWALTQAIEATQQNRVIEDREMRLYAGANQEKALGKMKAKRGALERALQEWNIAIVRPPAYSATDVQQYGFETAKLEDFIGIKRMAWSEQGIANDVSVLWQVQMQRKADYTDYFGTNKRLPVFVTSNRDLVGLVLHYPDTRSRTPVNTGGWRRNRLPLITDVWLTCRLWTPGAENDRLGTMRLADAVVAACAPNANYVARICERLEELQREHPELEGMPASEYLSDTLMDAVYDKADGKISEVTLDKMMVSLEEIKSASIAAAKAKWEQQAAEERAVQERKLQNLRKETEDNQVILQGLRKDFSALQSAVAQAQASAAAAKEKLIENAVQSHCSDLPVRARCRLHFSNKLGLIAGLFGAAVGAALPSAFPTTAWWINAVGGACGFFIGAGLGNKLWRLRLLEKADQSVGQRYDGYINKKLLPNELEYADEIIARLRGQHPLWRECRSQIRKLRED